jgi:hypothetical protein
MNELCDFKEFLKDKNLNDLKKIIHNTKNLIKRDTESIPNLDELNDKNKGAWIEHEDNDFTKIYNGLLNYCKDEDEEFDNLDWNTVNYEILGEDYYQNKFPGFPDEVYKILADSTENKFVDETKKILEIKNCSTIIDFN